MLTIHKRRLASLTTLTGLSIFSAGMALADTDTDLSSPDTGSYRPADRIHHLTCRDPLQPPRFKRQLEMTECATQAPPRSPAPPPPDCEPAPAAGAGDGGAA